MARASRPPGGPWIVLAFAPALAACPRAPTAAPSTRRDGGAAARPTVSARARCPWVWAAPTALPLAAEPGRFELTATCLGGASLAVAWRAGGVVRLATRTLSEDAPWRTFGGDGPVATDAVAISEPVPAERALWVAWQSAAGFLKVAQVTADAARASAPIQGWGARPQMRLSDPHIVHAAGGRALLAATARTAAGARALLFPVGTSGAVARGAYVLGDGVVAATTTGAHPRVALVAGQPSGAWSLRGVRLDPVRALALDPPVGDTPLPADVTTGSAALDLGLGRFEVVPEGAPVAGAFLFETVIGAERGAVRVARFPSEGGGTLSVLPVVATALGDVTDDAAGVTVTYWDDRHVLRAATLRAAGMERPRALALPTTEAAESHGTRVVACGGERWVLFALRATGAMALHAAREGCVERGDAAPPRGG